jgi:hypothetical protein
MLAQELWPWMMDPCPFERCGHACFVFFFLPPREERVGKGVMLLFFFFFFSFFFFLQRAMKMFFEIKVVYFDHFFII